MHTPFRLALPPNPASMAGMKRYSIGIVGAGMGGLAAAALLARAGHDVCVIERFSTAGPVGSGLVLQPVGLAVLDEIGAGDAARALAAPINHMLGHAGRRAVLDVRYAPGAPGLAMHRAALFAVLWDAAMAAGVVVKTAAQVTGAPMTGAKRWVDVLGSDRLGPFDLVIDASGAGSPLSPLHARPLPFGAVWGHVPMPPDSGFAPDRLSQRYLGAHRMAGVLPIGQLPGDPTPRAAVFWSLPRADLANWDTCNQDAWRAEVVAFWPEMAAFVNQAPVMTPAAYSHGTLRRPYAPALVFIGDAAHRASPQLGQGANMALLDAMALATALATCDLDDALSRYAALRRWHVRSYQGMSAAFTPMYQSHSKILPKLRDHLLAPMAQLPPVRSVLTRLVSGTLLPPLASTPWPRQSAGPRAPETAFGDRHA